MRPGANRQPTAEERRRAQRVLLRMPVIVHLTGKTNPIHGFTHTVSATGAMIILAEGLTAGTKFTLEIPKRSSASRCTWYGPRSSAREARSFQSSFCPPRPNSGISFFRRTSTDDPIGVAKPIPEDRRQNLGVVFQNGKNGYPFPRVFSAQC